LLRLKTELSNDVKAVVQGKLESLVFEVGDTIQMCDGLHHDPDLSNY
jgi:hypothetical protein